MQVPKLKNNTEFRIKWACTNLPYIDFDDGVNVSNRIFLKKSDVVAIINAMQEFVAFYHDEFSADRINEDTYDQ